VNFSVCSLQPECTKICKGTDAMLNLEDSEYVAIVVTVPETHADLIREAIGNAGGAKWGNYTFCSFSSKGIARFTPQQESDPFIGTKCTPETVVEEKIETVCTKDCLKEVLEAIKKAHPYESTYIDIRPIYKQACKFP
jgi:hypothetical protein